MRRLLETALCGALFLILPARAATIVIQSGAIVRYLSNLPTPGAGTNAFVIPTNASITAWRPVVDALFSGNYQTAANLAAPMDYNVVQFTDSGRNRIYYLLSSSG